MEALGPMTGKKAVDREHFFQMSSCKYNFKVHSTKLSQQRASLDVRKFSQRVMNEWNLLLQEVVDVCEPVQEPSAESINQSINQNLFRVA